MRDEQLRIRELEAVNAQITRHRDSLAAQLAAATDALRELVELKDGPRSPEYQRRRPLAWAAARAVLEGDTEPKEGT